ncbi:unnamed protein product [Gongylonema pulchrum]|uniref:Tudor domain-containing protein n=1 Tax=Gongylonema pulchrum TaxID=637853 RepID=A0A183D2I5_9BILA|nr:unnamed protein product [Gongylonema pulchrum]
MFSSTFFHRHFTLFVQTATDALSISLTVLFRDRAIACLPLYSNNYRPFTSALLVGLKDAEASVSVVHGAYAEAKFTDFKVVFVDNLEEVVRSKAVESARDTTMRKQRETSLEEAWINGQETIRTNFALFPLGVCKIISKKVKRSADDSRMFVISVQCSFKGLTFDIDSNIGHLLGALKNTCAAIDEDQDLDPSEYQSLKVTLGEAEHDEDLDPKNEYACLVKPESRIRWVEQKVSIIPLLKYH